jgi:hypothetical protein
MLGIVARVEMNPRTSAPVVKLYAAEG